MVVNSSCRCPPVLSFVSCACVEGGGRASGVTGGTCGIKTRQWRSCACGEGGGRASGVTGGTWDQIDYYGVTGGTWDKSGDRRYAE